MFSMTITSLSFLIFIIIAAGVYYITPGKVQWITLLILSAAFYCFAAAPYTIVFLILSALSAYIAGIISEKEGKIRVTAASAAIIFNVAVWFLFKGSAYWIKISTLVHSVCPSFPVLSAVPLAAAFGMGYYTFQTTGYILDTLWGTAKPQKNFLKLLLFLLFFPQLTTGPISRYNALTTLYEERRFDIDRLHRGAQRILWGFFKKLVLAERLSRVVDTVYSGNYEGLWLVLSFLLYPMQLYADFSGSVDIVLGTAEIFGIDLVENFNNPFFAETSQEFWQRWHMSLGSWVKDYIMYPVLKSPLVLRAGEKMKKKYGKRAGKLTSLSMGIFATWMVIGIWHGDFRYILGCGVYYWAVMISYEILSPSLSKLNRLLGIDENSFSHRLFKKIRTYLVLCFSMVFFRSDGIGSAVKMLKKTFLAFTPPYFNPWIFVNGRLKDTNLTGTDLFIILLSLLLLLLAALMRERYVHARDFIASQGLLFRWGAYIALFVLVIVYGYYGPGYEAADFIYQGF